MSFLLINKPSGPTSHDMVDKLRRITGIRKIGHAGTLDPFATGLLIMAIERASTRRLDEFLKQDKTYRATLTLGATSDTYDRTGTIKKTVGAGLAPAQVQPQGVESWRQDSTPLQKTIEDALMYFEGPLAQTPPMYSAKKIKGKKLYELARQGQTVERKPNWILIHSISDVILEQSDRILLKLIITCSSGTYIRSLAHDLGQTLGCGAYLEELERISIGPHTLDNAVTVDKLTPENWQHYTVDLQSTGERPIRSEVRLNSPTTLVFGTFDHLHPGHLNFFQQARALDPSARLVAGIGRDAVVEQIKNHTPDLDELTRLREVKNAADIDHAYLMPEQTSDRFDWIARLNPTNIALGYDQTALTENLAEELKERGCIPTIATLKPHHPEKYKSSLVKKEGLD